MFSAVGEFLVDLFGGSGSPAKVVQSPPVCDSPGQSSFDLLGKLLGFWDVPAIADADSRAGGRPEAPRPESAAVAAPACHSAISGRAQEEEEQGEAQSKGGSFTAQRVGRAVATVSLARGARLLRVRMSGLKALQKVRPGFQTDLGQDDLPTIDVGWYDDRESVTSPDVKRGTVQGFSMRSRGRLMDLINSIDQGKAPSRRWRFITLTYHEQKVTPRDSKEHLRAFLKRLDRKFGRSGVIWKVEPQKRGMQHYHLLALLPAEWQADLESEREWFANAWVEITEGTHSQYLVHRYGDNPREAAWQQLEDWEHVAGYCGKYVGKVVNVPNESEWTKAGRWWGKVNGDLLPVNIESVTFLDREAYQLQRTMRRLAKAKAREKGFVWDMGNGVIRDVRDCWGGNTWATRKRIRGAGGYGMTHKLRHSRPWIRGGFGGRLYIPEGEALRIILFARGTRIGFGPGEQANYTILGYDENVTDNIPF